MAAPLRIPQGLEWVGATAEGRRWLEALPSLVAEVARDWDLELGRAYPYAHASVAIPARTMAGTAVVLKLQLPDEESRAEADALRAWNGSGAVRLLDADPGRRALLLERCVPGSALLDEPLAAVLDVLTGLLPRLWIRPPRAAGSLTDECARWSAGLEAAWERSGRALPRPVLDAALQALAELPPSQGETVLLNQDLHAGNVLAAEREPWLVIDPKPLAGEREFALAPVLRDVARRDPAALVPTLDRMCAAFGLDRDRARRWALGQAVAWGFDDGTVDPLHAQVACTLHEA